MKHLGLDRRTFVNIYFYAIEWDNHNRCEEPREVCDKTEINDG